MEWICRLDIDTYFLAPNFLRFVLDRDLDPRKPWFLGMPQAWHKHFEPLLYHAEEAKCFSAVAWRRLAAHLATVPTSGHAADSAFDRCARAAGHREDLMLAVCFRELGIFPLDTTDERGRAVFVNFPLEHIANYTPPRMPLMPDPRNFITVENSDRAQHWAGRIPTYLPCLEDNAHWVSPFPVNFHGYKLAPAMRRIHAVLRGWEPCDWCNGYRWQIAGNIIELTHPQRENLNARTYSRWAGS